MSFDKIKDLRDRHNRIVAEAQSYLDERGGELDSEGKAKWDAMMAEATDLRTKSNELEDRYRQVQEAQTFIDNEPDLTAAARTFSVQHMEDTPAFREVKDAEERRAIRNSALNKWLRGNTRELTDQERGALRPVAPGSFEVRGQQLAGTSGSGGVTVADEYEMSVLMQLKDYGGMRSVARILRTATGGTYNIPASDDTGNTASIVGEASTFGSTHVPFTNVALEAVKYASGPIKVSLELMQDSFIDIEAFVRDAIVTRFGRATEGHFATRSSTEASGPHGITNYSTGNVVIVGTTADPLNFDDIIDLVHGVDPAYRRSASAGFMFNDATLGVIAKLKDNDGQYLWRPTLTDARPQNILGYPFTINQDLPSYVAAGTSTYPKFLWFGDWSHYVVRDVLPITLFRANERYIDQGNIGFFGFGRFDGRATFATATAAAKPIQCIMQST